MLSGNFDSEIRALHRNNESFHFKHLLGAEFHTYMAPLAVLLDNLDSRKFLFHLLSPLVK